MAAEAKISRLQLSELQRALIDVAQNTNKQRKIPKPDKYDGTPLDTSPGFESFLEACRRGDMKSCHEHIVAGVNINGRDIYDYTPLIIASICGHYELVKLLLDYGALAERNTFQGERCIYGALTLRIRKLLLSYDFSKSTDPLREWSEHINKLADGAGPTSPDFTLRLDNGSECEVHRFLLSARSPFFRDLFNQNPTLKSWTAKTTNVRPESLYLVSKFLYMEQIPDTILRHRNSTEDTTASEVIHGCEKLAKEFDLDGFLSILSVGDDLTVARKRHQEQIDATQLQMFDFFNNHILKNKIIVTEEELKNVTWTTANPALADVMIKVEYLDEEEQSEDEIEVPDIDNLGISDQSSALEASEPADPPKKWVIYPVHKSILCRSDYFIVMFTSGFVEAHITETLHIIGMACAAPTLEVILGNFYSEKGEISLAYSLDLLYTADSCFLQKLVNKAALTISSQGMADSNVWVDRTHKNIPKKTSKTTRADPPDDIDIYEIIHAAWDLKVVRLEQFAARFFASRLEDFLDTPDFADIIRESADRTQNRHATDTIELLDDIRHYLEERFRMRFQDLNLVLAKDQAQKEKIRAQEEQDKKKKTAIKTLSGEMAVDEFMADDMNYNYLMEKIDALLDKLGLSA